MKSPFVILSTCVFVLSSLASCLSQDSAHAESPMFKDTTGTQPVNAEIVTPEPTASTVLDTPLYNEKMEHMLNGDSSGKWPVKAPLPLAGAILPFKTIIAFYGNLYSKQMGILGELPRKQMLEKLQGEMARWKKADS